MQNGRDSGKVVTAVGAILFLLLVAALSLSLYGEVLSKTKAAVLMVCATISAFVVSIGRYLQSAERESAKQDRTIKKNAMDS